MGTQGLPHVHSEPKEDPPHPFHTIHIDHKRLVPSGETDYSYLLIVVDALTRWTIAIPCLSTTAEEVCQGLFSQVFSIYSFPVTVVSDNAFDTSLLAAFSEYAGFRKIYILPNNPRSNGLAEATVKRVSGLLVRHCRSLTNWHLSVPMICHLLNCTVHSGTRASPFSALFGRHPICVPELEHPLAQSSDSLGREFLCSLSQRLRLAWDALCVIVQ